MKLAIISLSIWSRIRSDCEEFLCARYELDEAPVAVAMNVPLAGRDFHLGREKEINQHQPQALSRKVRFPPLLPFGQNSPGAGGPFAWGSIRRLSLAAFDSRQRTASKCPPTAFPGARA